MGAAGTDKRSRQYSRCVDALDAARASLPGWVVWGPLVVYPIVAFLWSAAVTALMAVVAGWPSPPPRDEPEHAWVERARRAYPARLVVALMVLFAPVISGVTAGLFAGDLLPGGWSALGAVAGLAAFIGAALVSYWLERRLWLGLEPRRFLRGMVVAWILLRGPLLIVAGANIAAADHFDARTLSILIAAGVAFVVVLLGGGTHVCRRLGAIAPADEALMAIVSRTAERVGRRPRAVWVARTLQANAWALVSSQQVVVTERARDALSEEELAAVVAHELGHLAEPRGVVLARRARMLALLPLCAVRTVVASRGLWDGLALVVVVLGVVLLTRRLSRRMEQRADAIAHEHQGQEGVYARALEKLYRANLMPVVLPKSGGTHGHLYDRLVGAGAPPPYPRPRPPATARRRLASLVLIGATFALLLSRFVLVGYAAIGHDRSSLYTAAAIGGTDRRMLEHLAEDASARGEPTAAATFLRAADSLEIGDEIGDGSK